MKINWLQTLLGALMSAVLSAAAFGIIGVVVGLQYERTSTSPASEKGLWPLFVMLGAFFAGVWGAPIGAAVVALRLNLRKSARLGAAWGVVAGVYCLFNGLLPMLVIAPLLGAGVAAFTARVLNRAVR